MGDKCKLMRPMGDTWETSANSCGPRHPERRQVWETSVGDKCGRQVGDKCKIMRPILQHAIERVGRPGGSQKGVGRKKNKCHSGPRHPE